jgi:hypothetical protein
MAGRLKGCPKRREKLLRDVVKNTRHLLPVVVDYVVWAELFEMEFL